MNILEFLFLCDTVYIAIINQSVNEIKFYVNYKFIAPVMHLNKSHDKYSSLNAICSSHKYVQPMKRKLYDSKQSLKLKKNCVNINLSHNVNKVPHFMK